MTASRRARRNWYLLCSHLTTDTQPTGPRACAESPDRVVTRDLLPGRESTPSRSRGPSHLGNGPSPEPSVGTGRRGHREGGVSMRWDVHQSLYERSATPWCHGFHFDTKLGRNINRRMRTGPDQTSQIPLSEGVSRSNLHEKSFGRADEGPRRGHEPRPGVKELRTPCLWA